MMQQVSFRDVYNFSTKSICDCLVRKGMNLEEALGAICKDYLVVKQQLELDQVRFGPLGIDTTCNLTYKNLLTEIINALIQNDIDFATSLASITATVNGIMQGTGTITDEKVKATAAAPAADYLDQLIKSEQAGKVSVVNNTIMLSGFVPLGAVIMISKSRLPDFDATGKGKAGTDVYGYAISNGQNGTLNRLGRMPKYAADVNDATKTGGTDALTLAEANLPSFSLPVGGTISEALVNPITADIRSFKQELRQGPSAGVWIISDTNTGNIVLKSDPLNVKHTHAFSLTAAKNNPAPTPIDLIPSHILEIPIERIII